MFARNGERTKGKGEDYSINWVSNPFEIWREINRVFWEAIQFPKLSSGGQPPNGFRANEKGYWQRDRITKFGKNNKINYINTENWHSDRLQARGRLSSKLRNSKTALIGCGALGSIVAELLIRGGVSELALIDDDKLKEENLVRHTLSGNDIDEFKTISLAKKLQSVAPFSIITPHTIKFPNLKKMWRFF